MSCKFSEKYQHIAAWVDRYGYISIGDDEFFSSWIRVFNQGGMIIEIEEAENIDEAFDKLEKYFEELFTDDWGYSIEI